MLIAFALSFLGLFFVYLEFFLPGTLFAILGGFSLVSGIVYFSLQEVLPSYKVLYFFINILATIGVCKWALWLIKNRKKEQFYLEACQEGFTASTFDETLIGKIGEAFSDMKPSGHILIGEKKYQALSDGLYILKGTPVFVLRGQGSYLIVEEKK